MREIDWTQPLQFVTDEHCVVLTSGYQTNSTFSGMIVKVIVDDGIMHTGLYDRNFEKEFFKPYKAELIL